MALLFGLSVGCAAPAPPAPRTGTTAEWFEDATERLGIRFVHDCGDATDYITPRVMGSGCAIFDADGDGRPDLLFLQNAGPGAASKNALYRQNADGTFTDVSAGSGLDVAGFNMGVAIGDIDNDGKPDILITQFMGAKLFRNLGNCQFEDITTLSGLTTPNWGTSAAFFDYDRDGRLDLVIVNYIEIDPKWPCVGPDGAREFCGPTHFPGAGKPIRLFHNEGVIDGIARFKDVSLEAGVGKLAAPGLGVYCADLTGDGWPDIVVANDTGPNRLWVNQKNGTFVDEGVNRGLAFTGMGQTAANMGVAVGDVDGDGLLDIFITHLTSEMNTLWRQSPRGMFKDRTLATGAVATKWRGTGFGTAMADFDRDGWVDLALVNGRVSRGPEKASNLPIFWQDYGERNQLLRNTGGKFEDVSEANPALCGFPNVGRGLAIGDIDGDGRPDVVTTTIAGPARVYLNRSNPEAHWLAVQPLTPAGSPAIGAEVQLTTSDGRRQIRTIQPAESYLCSSLPEAIFGLGDATSLTSFLVRWLDGTEQQLPPGPVDRRFTVTQPR